MLLFQMDFSAQQNSTIYQKEACLPTNRGCDKRLDCVLNRHTPLNKTVEHRFEPNNSQYNRTAFDRYVPDVAKIDPIQNVASAHTCAKEDIFSPSISTFPHVLEELLRDCHKQDAETHPQQHHVVVHTLNTF